MRDPTQTESEAPCIDADAPVAVLDVTQRGTDEAVLIVGPDGCEIVACNAAAGELFGYEVDELLGQSARILHVDGRRFEEFAHLRESVLEREEQFRVAWEMKRKDGTVFPSFHTVALLSDSLGLGGGTVSIVRDRSRMDDAASVLEELGKRYRVLFDENPEALLVYDVQDRRILAANAALAAIYGGEPEDLLGRDVAELVLEDDRPSLQSFLRARSDDDLRVSRWRIPRADGAVRLLRVTSRAVRFAGRPARLAVTVDVTETEKAERLAQRLSAILDATPDFVGIGSGDLCVEHVNPAGRRLVGLDPETDVTGLAVRDFSSADSWELLREHAIPAAIREGVWQGETAFVDREGAEIPVSQVILAHRSPDGALEFLSTIARDMREHLELERQLRGAQRMEAVGRLAGGIAHDFNNILTALTGFAELARADLGDTEAVRRHLDEIIQSAQRAAELTHNLLSFSRQQVLEPRVVVLDDILRRVEGMLRRTLEERVHLEVRPESGAARITVDPAQLEQVILKLAINARDAMPEGGQLTFETDAVRLERDAPRNGYTIPAGEYVRLRALDTGTGMDEATRSRVFEPFFTTKPLEVGTGLGLSTAYGIIKQSGGYIEVESELGEGTTFTILLPRTWRQAEEPRVPAMASGRHGNLGTVLVAEDDNAVRRMIRLVLTAAAYEVLEADCGVEALALRERTGHAVDLLVTDVVMPRMNGQELARQLRRFDPGIPVVYISGYSYSALGGEFVPEASTSFLRKPFSAEALLEAVRQLLESGRRSDT